MTDEAKKVAAALRICGQSGVNICEGGAQNAVRLCNECPNQAKMASGNAWECFRTWIAAADLIERLSAKVEELEKELADCEAQRSANMFAANTHCTAAEMWKQRAEAAEDRLSGLLSHVTSGKFSKAEYALEDMRRMVDDECNTFCEVAKELNEWKQRAEAAERDINDMLQTEGGNLDLCHWCKGACSKPDEWQDCSKKGWRGPCPENSGGGEDAGTGSM